MLSIPTNGQTNYTLLMATIICFVEHGCVYWGKTTMNILADLSGKAVKPKKSGSVGNIKLRL